MRSVRLGSLGRWWQQSGTEWRSPWGDGCLTLFEQGQPGTAVAQVDLDLAIVVQANTIGALELWDLGAAGQVLGGQVGPAGQCPVWDLT